MKTVVIPCRKVKDTLEVERNPQSWINIDSYMPDKIVELIAIMRVDNKDHAVIQILE